MGAVDAQVRLTGGCQCGAVRYRLDGDPAGANICHCRMCQKASGGPFMAFGGVRLDQLVWTRGKPAVFVSSAIAERGFCAECGTPLTYRVLDHDRIAVTIGSLDAPSAVAPGIQYGVEFEAGLARFDIRPSASRHQGIRWPRRRCRFTPASRSRHLMTMAAGSRRRPA